VRARRGGDVRRLAGSAAHQDDLHDQKFIVSWDKWHYIEAVTASVVVVMIASLIPARRAARLEPGDIIRGTAQ